MCDFLKKFAVLDTNIDRAHRIVTLLNIIPELINSKEHSMCYINNYQWLWFHIIKEQKFSLINIIGQIFDDDEDSYSIYDLRRFLNTKKFDKIEITDEQLRKWEGCLSGYRKIYRKDIKNWRDKVVAHSDKNYINIKDLKSVKLSTVVFGLKGLLMDAFDAIVNGQPFSLKPYHKGFSPIEEDARKLFNKITCKS